MVVALADGLGTEADSVQDEEAEAETIDDEGSSQDEEELGEGAADSAEIALLDQSEAEADAEAETVLLIHSDEDADAVMSVEADSVGEGEAASVETDCMLELLISVPVAEDDALGAGCMGTWPVGGTQIVWVEVMSTTTVVVAVIGSPLSSSPNPASTPIALAC